MKRKLLLIIVSLLLLSSLTLSAFSEEQISLRLFFWFDATDLGDWETSINEFREHNPNIEVIIEGSSWNEYWTKLQTQSTSSSVADVFGMVSMYSKDYIKNGVTLGLKELMDKEDFDSSIYYNAIMSAYSDGNQYHCLPYDLSTNLLIVNLDILEESGVEYKPEGYSREEFIDVMKSIKDKGYYGVSMQPLDWSYLDILSRAGVNILDNEGKLLLAQEPAYEITQWLADLIKDGYSPLTVPGLDLFASGQLAMTYVNPENVAVYTREMSTTKLDVIPYPTDIAEGQCIAEGGAWAIYSGTKHPEAAWKLLKALTSAKNAREMVGATHRGVPPTNDKDSVKSMLESPYAVPHSMLYIDLLDSSTRIDFPNRTAVENEMRSFLSLIYSGEMTAEEGLKEFQKIADDLMAQDN